MRDYENANEQNRSHNWPKVGYHCDREEQEHKLAGKHVRCLVDAQKNVRSLIASKDEIAPFLKEAMQHIPQQWNSNAHRKLDGGIGGQLGQEAQEIA